MDRDGPSVEAITRATYDNIAEEYCRDTPAPVVRETIKRQADEFNSHLRIGSAIAILGCGDGRDAGWFLDWGHRVCLVDYSRAMANLARKRVADSHVLLADFRFLPFARNSFDAVWASACFYHVRKSFVRGIFDQILDVLRPGGLLFFNLRKGTGEKLDPHPRSFPRGGPRFYAFYSESEVNELVSMFEVIRVESFDAVLKDDYFQLIVRKQEKSDEQIQNRQT